MYKTAIALKCLATAQRDIEDFTQVVISYEMTTSVRLCLSYDPLKWVLSPSK